MAPAPVVSSAGGSQQLVEFAATVERREFVVTPHVALANEDLRYGTPSAGFLQHQFALARRLVELETAHIVGRRELDERLTALTALDAAYAETTHALAGLRAEHETLRAEHERVRRELGERCQASEERRHLAVQQLETLLTRLRQ